MIHYYHQRDQNQNNSRLPVLKGPKARVHQVADAAAPMSPSTEAARMLVSSRDKVNEIRSGKICDRTAKERIWE